MQVKKFEAASVLDALRQVKEDLGPDAIVLSTQEAKRSVTGAKRFVVVAAISEQQYRKKELAKSSLGSIYDTHLKERPASQQKAFLDNYYKDLEEKYHQRTRKKTQVPYHQIIDEDPEVETAIEEVPRPTQSQSLSTPVAESARVKSAAAEALRSSLSSQFFTNSPNEEILEEAPRWSHPLQAMFARLKAAGLDKTTNEKWRLMASQELTIEAEKKSSVDSWYAKKILATIQVCESRQVKKVQVFVGPRGSGKSSSLIKIATRDVIEHGLRIAFITTDIDQVGTVEQMRTYGRILNAPVFVQRDPAELAARLSELSDFDRVYVDTPGISMSHIADLDFIRSLSALKSHFDCGIHLVISATTKDKDLGGLIKRFQVSQFDDVIMTNIDQTSQHGNLINAQLLTNKPFHSFGIGMDMIEGLETATKERVLDLIFKLTHKSGEKENGSRV